MNKCIVERSTSRLLGWGDDGKFDPDDRWLVDPAPRRPPG